MSSALNYRYPAIQGDDDMGCEFEDEFEGEQFGGGLSRALGGFRAGGSEGEEETEAEFDFEVEAESEYEGEAEGEYEEEAEEEGEAFVNPVRRIYRDAELMAHLSTRAAQTESEAEAEAFVAALVPIAGRLIPRAGRSGCSTAATTTAGERLPGAVARPRGPVAAGHRP